MLNYLNKRYSLFVNILIWICLFIFIFIVRQNSAKANNFNKLPSYKSPTQTINKVASIYLKQKVSSAKIKYNKEFDLNSDYSLQKYISDKNLLNNKKYHPVDLLQIDTDYIVNRAWRPYLRQPALLAFEQMVKQFNNDTNKKIYLISAYRTYRDQATLFEWWCSSKRCAKIWWSEHQLWLAVDIHVATINWYNHLDWKELKWMQDNAYKYWYINTYRKWVDIDGKIKEVRHWRYVWVPFAKELYKNDMTFAEYYNANK